MITNSRGRLFQIAAKQTFCTSRVGNMACHSVWLLCDPAWSYPALSCFQDGSKRHDKNQQWEQSTNHGDLQGWRTQFFILNNSVITIIWWFCFWWSLWEQKMRGKHKIAQAIQSLRCKRPDWDQILPPLAGILMGLLHTEDTTIKHFLCTLLYFRENKHSLSQRKNGFILWWQEVSLK